MNRRLLIKGAAALTLGGAVSASRAQSAAWPNRPIRIIVPHAAGNSPDVVCRILGDKLGQALGQAVVVENRLGAGGMLGTEIAAGNPADGYSLLFTVKGVLAIGPHLHLAAKFNPLRDFKAVTEVLVVPHVITANLNTPYSTMKEFVDYARANPGKIDYASTGIGSQPHVALATLASRLGIRINHIPYRTSPSPDLMGGVVSLYLDASTTAIPLIKAGKVKALAISGIERISALPDLPTLTEYGGPSLDPEGVVGNSWQGLFAPAATPPEIVARLNAELVRIVAMPEIQTRLRSLGLTPTGTSSVALASRLAADHAYWGQLVREAGIKAE